MNTTWNDCTYRLETFTGVNRSPFVTLQEVYNHINPQIPEKYSRDNFLIHKISNNYPDLRTAIASVCINSNDMRNVFEKPTSFFLPVCPYSKHRSTNNTNTCNPEISYVTLKGKGNSKLAWIFSDTP